MKTVLKNWNHALRGVSFSPETCDIKILGKSVHFNLENISYFPSCSGGPISLHHSYSCTSRETFGNPSGGGGGQGSKPITRVSRSWTFQLGFPLPGWHHGLRLKAQPRSQGTLSTSRKYPGYGWSRVQAYQPKPLRGWVLNLILSTLLSRVVNVALLYGRYFEKEASYLSEILSGQLLRLYLNFYEYGMLIERELYLYFTAFLNNCHQPVSE